MLVKAKYRKPPTISPGLAYFRKRFLMGLYKGGLIYGGGGVIHGRSFVLVITSLIFHPAWFPLFLSGNIFNIPL